MNVNLYVIEDYENEPPSGPKKQTQSNPIDFQIPSINSKDRLVIYNGKYRLDVPAFAGKQTDVIIVPENGQYSFTAFFT